MPNKPPVHRPPTWPDPAATRAAFNQRRAAENAKTYDAAWRKLRAAFLRASPSCSACGRRATQVDHIISVRERPDLRLDWGNLRALCASCHSRRTASDQGFGRAARERAAE